MVTDSLNNIINNTGVIDSKCYGCGRCIPICPLGLIEAREYTSNHDDILHILSSGQVDAIEVHTHYGNEVAFAQLWSSIGAHVLQTALVIAVSFPNMAGQTIPYLNKLQRIMSMDSNNETSVTEPTRTTHNNTTINTITSSMNDISDSWLRFKQRNGVHVWQADGRPMSGDISKGTAHSTTTLAQQLLQHPSTTNCTANTDTNIISDTNISNNNNNDDATTIQFKPTNNMHYIQLAGGTNDYSSTLALQHNLTTKTGFGGYAFGGYARKRINRYLNELENKSAGACVEHYSAVYEQCLEIALALVRTVKRN